MVLSTVDHLEPEDGVFAGASLLSYELALKSLLLTHPRRQVQMVSVPSFRSEEAVYVAKEQGELVVVTSKIEGHLWSHVGQVIRNVRGRYFSETPTPSEQAAAVARAKVERAVAPISAGAIGALSEVWAAALLRTRRLKDKALGLDGETFHFADFAPGQGQLSGKIWSPQGPNLTALVALGNLLSAFARASPPEQPALEKQLTTDAVSLLSAFEATPQ
jgi:hypothetical protein